MARSIRAIQLTGVGASPGQLIFPRAGVLHGWVLTETNAAAGFVQFRSAAGNNQKNQDGPVVVGSPVLFERTVLASADLPAFLDHEGIFLSGGLFITCSSTAQVTGVVLIS